MKRICSKERGILDRDFGLDRGRSSATEKEDYSRAILIWITTRVAEEGVAIDDDPLFSYTR